MSEFQLIRHCSPTLAGLKTANMFTCDASCPKVLRESLRSLNARLRPKGVRAVPIRIQNGKALIYLYRPKRLLRDLSDTRARRILDERGYRKEGGYLRHLQSRLTENEEFPHEIGLFLGYPPEDVDGFISDPSACRYVGYWKVYGDEIRAKRTFAQFRKCTEVYSRKWEEGRSLDRLTVSA